MNERKNMLMYKMFGKTEGATCANCRHLIRRQYNKVFYKCAVYGLSCSNATDWAKSYAACGLYNKTTKHKDVAKLVRTLKDQTITGQIDIFEEM